MSFNGRTARGPEPRGRLLATWIALGAATAGYALASALSASRESDAFVAPPSVTRIAAYLAAFVMLSALTVLIDAAVPLIAQRGRSVVRDLQAALRLRLRHGRTRVEIARVEVGLAVSASLVAALALMVLAPARVLMTVATIIATIASLASIAWWCRLGGYERGWSALFGLVWGLAAGALLT